MVREPGCATSNSEDGDRTRRRRTKANAEPATRSTSRRRALAAVGTFALGATAGCLDSVQGIGSSRVEVTPEDPGDDPEATPNEFHFLLEKNGITVDELYHDTEDDDLILFYESAAETGGESDDEIALIYRVFSEGLIDRGSDVNHLYTEVVDRFDGQVEGWAVNAEWAEEHLAEEVSGADVWNAIVDTMVYPEGEERFDFDEGNDTDDGAETGGDVSDDGDDIETDGGDSDDGDDSDEDDTETEGDDTDDTDEEQDNSTDEADDE
ncbi:hypothetical protein [Natronorubrum halalkaliphilum]|uniref:hypothetical protein n=1 Tax=Natronorubrum halalkaliphilum TaxID=2691917 RepID=UPI001F2BA3B4|nr:hypothetical protein [Natronorubrum halalkaliphilum]